MCNAGTLARAETALAELVASCRTSAPKLSAWLEENAPEGLAVFTLPEHHRRRLRTSNPMERSVQQDLKRRTERSGSFQATTPCCDWSAPSWWRSTRNGPPKPRPASNGNARMRDPLAADFPDPRLLNHEPHSRSPLKGATGDTIYAVLGVSAVQRIGLGATLPPARQTLRASQRRDHRQPPASASASANGPRSSVMPR